MKKTCTINFREMHPGRMLLTALTVSAILIIVCPLYSCIREGKAVDSPSLAVIPFSNSMCDPEMEYISAGLHDAIVSELGNINSLMVKSKTATQQYLDSELPGQQIGDELGANVIVKHSLICTDDGMRLLIQLINLFPEEKEIWSNTYDLDLSNSLTIYRDITKQIAKNIQADITTQEKTYLNASRSVNAELYKKYLQGVFYMNKLTPEGVKQGIQYLNEAMAIDPKEPLPYLALALGYSNAGHVSDAGPDAPRLAREYALKALELDSTLAEAYTVLATQYLYGDWDFPATEKALKRSIILNPNIAALHYTLGWYLCLTNDFDEAEKEMKLAVEIEPLDPFCSGYAAWFYLWTGKFDDAVTMSQRALELNPNDAMALYVLGSAYAEKGLFDQAIETHKKGIALEPTYTCGLGVAYALAGRKKEALMVAADMEKANNAWYTWGIADIYAVLGDKDKTIHWVETSYNQHDQFFPWTGINRHYTFLFEDPRFREIIDRLHLPA